MMYFVIIDTKVPLFIFHSTLDKKIILNIIYNGKGVSMNRYIKFLIIGCVFATLLFAPSSDKVSAENEGGRVWVEGQRGWQENGTYLWTSVAPLPTYNVGIGTSTPSYTLHVAGISYGDYNGSTPIASGVYGLGSHNNTATSAKGIIGMVNQPPSTYIGLAVCGFANSDEAIGGWFWGDNIQQATGYWWSGTGVIAVGSWAAVIGNTNDPDGWALTGYSSGNTDACGVYGYNSTSGIYAYIADNFGYGIYSNGVKSTVMPTSQGEKVLFCPESPEVLFVDYGTGRLNNGRAYVALDPTFLEITTIDRTHPYRVVVTPTDMCNGVYVIKREKGFDVIETDNGTSNATFDYQVIAYRKGWEDKRFPAGKPRHKHRVSHTTQLGLKR